MSTNSHGTDKGTACVLTLSAVVRFQHKHYIPIALFSGLVLPTLIASWGWGDAVGGFVWGGVMGRLVTW